MITCAANIGFLVESNARVLVMWMYGKNRNAA